MRGGSAFKYDAPLRSRHPDPELDAQGPMRVESQKGSILQCGTTCASAHPLPRGCEGSKHASRKRRAHSDECSRPLTPSLPSLPASPVVSLLGRVRNPRPCSVRRRVVPQRRERGVQLVGERGAVLPSGAATSLAQPAYATTRSRLQPCGGPSAAMLCKLCSLSASVTSAAASLSRGALETASAFLNTLPCRLSSLHSSTVLATACPKRSSRSAYEVSSQPSRRAA